MKIKSFYSYLDAFLQETPYTHFFKLSTDAKYCITQFATNIMFTCFSYLTIINDFKKETTPVNQLRIVFELIFEGELLKNVLLLTDTVKDESLISMKYMKFISKNYDIDDNSLLILSHIIQYLCFEILEISCSYIKHMFEREIQTSHIHKCLENDEDFINLMKKCSIKLPVTTKLFKPYANSFMSPNMKCSKKNIAFIEKIIETKMNDVLQKINNLKLHQNHECITQHDVLLVLNTQ